VEFEQALAFLGGTIPRGREADRGDPQRNQSKAH
jgi:hypothetical protein